MRLLILVTVAAALGAEPPRVAVVDFYGHSDLDRQTLVRAAGIAAGDPLPASKADIEERLEKLGNVVRAQVEAACCENGGFILYVGVESKGAPHFDYRQAPAGDQRLPNHVVENYRQLFEAVQHAPPQDTTEDVSKGHAFFKGRRLRRYQERFIVHNELYRERLPSVLRESADADHRAMAAQILGYAPRKRDVVDHLLYALQDPADAVRVNALRSLTAISVLAAADPELEIRIPPTWIVEMLHSIGWDDRYQAARALALMTAAADKPRTGPASDALKLIGERALKPLAEMARWTHLPHALPAFLLLGRVAGLSEPEIHSFWTSGNREEVIRRATASASSDK